MEFIKPTATEVAEYQSTIQPVDGITAYAVSVVVNGWLAAESVSWTDSKGRVQTQVTSQRVYNQYGKQIAEELKLGARFTDEGARQLAQLVYKDIVAKANAQVAQPTDEELEDELDEDENDLVETDES